MQFLSLSKAAKAKGAPKRAPTTNKTSPPVPPPAPAPSTPVGAGLGLFDDNKSSSLRRVVPAEAQRTQTPLGDRLGSLFGDAHVPFAKAVHGSEQPGVQAAATVVTAAAPTQVLQG